jgi:hypothetical protein
VVEKVNMTPEELRQIGEELFGNWGWQTKLAKALRVDGSTIRRWISGHTAIPGPAEVALEMMLKEKQKIVQT